MPRSALAVVLLLVLAACATFPPALPPPTGGDRTGLWTIVHDQCLPEVRDHRSLTPPCVGGAVDAGGGQGVLLIKDRVGVAQFLLLPAARITGIEDPALLAPGGLNYFARAWDERGRVSAALGRPLDRTQLAVTANSPYGRTQTQLHLHISCLDGGVRQALTAVRLPANGRWAAQTIMLKGHRYHIRWLAADALQATDPIRLLADSLPGAGGDMGAWTLALVGARRADGTEGFWLLADRANPPSDVGSAEELQDHACGG